MKQALSILIVLLAFAVAIAIYLYTSVVTLNETLTLVRTQGTQNITALTTSETYFKNKVNDLSMRKETLLITNQELENTNLKLAKQVADYKIQFSSAVSTTAVVENKIPTEIEIIIPLDIPSKDSTFKIKDSILDFSFVAHINPNSILIRDYNYRITLPLFVAFENEKTSTTVIIKSALGVRFTNTQSYSVPHKVGPKTKLGIGLHFGIGMFATDKIRFSPTIAIGINYNIIQLKL